MLSMAKSVVSTIREDLANARDHDPAARGDVENAVVYSGLHAIWMHRVCHVMWKRGWKGAARILAQANRFLTGIETVSYTHLTLPTIHVECRSRWSPYH